jgi:hypothetical protein
MAISRRELIRWMGGACSALPMVPRVLANGSAEIQTYQSARSSLPSYQVPEWFRDAKFWIWSH